jgi:hypothetical protein
MAKCNVTIQVFKNEKKSLRLLFYEMSGDSIQKQEFVSAMAIGGFSM